MTTYINFCPGDSRDERSIELSVNPPAWPVYSHLSHFIWRASNGVAASIKADGVKEALENGAFLARISADQEIPEDELQELVEEIHAAL